MRVTPSAEVPVLCLASGEAGPTVVVTANVHGDEAAGVAAAHALGERLVNLLARGTVWIYPSLNPDGLAAASRVLPGDGSDLNRCFPGHARGRVSERHANALWTDIVARAPDLAIDMHADSLVAIPYAIVDRPVALTGRRRRAMARRLEDAAAATGLTVVREYADDDYQRYALESSLTGALVNRHGVPALTVEVGARRVITHEAVEVHTDAALGVLAHVGLVDGVQRAHASRVGGGPWRRRSAPRAGAEGLLRPLYRPGDAFEPGETLAEVVDLEGCVRSTLRSDGAGIVIAWAEAPWVRSSDVTGTLAVHDDEAL